MARPTFLQVSAQLVVTCRSAIAARGKLWEQDRTALLSDLDMAVQLYEAFQEQYRAVQERDTAPKFSWHEDLVFTKLETYAKRCVQMMTWYKQLAELSPEATYLCCSVRFLALQHWLWG